MRPLVAARGASLLARSTPAARAPCAGAPDDTTLDADGRPFVPFAVDVRFGADWHENDIVGCAYTGSGNVYVKRGDEYRPASFLVGKNDGPVSGVCQAGS